MGSKVAVCSVDLRLISVRMCDPRAKVVANRQGTHPFEVLIHPHMAVEPHRKLLRESRGGKGVGACSKRSNKQLRPDQLAGLRVNQRDAVAEIHEGLLSATVSLTQHHLELF